MITTSSSVRHINNNDDANNATVSSQPTILPINELQRTYVATMLIKQLQISQLLDLLLDSEHSPKLLVLSFRFVD